MTFSVAYTVLTPVEISRLPDFDFFVEIYLTSPLGILSYQCFQKADGRKYLWRPALLSSARAARSQASYDL